MWDSVRGANELAKERPGYADQRVQEASSKGYFVHPISLLRQGPFFTMPFLWRHIRKLYHYKHKDVSILNP